MENEEIEYWKDVIGYEGLYQVSSYGRVKSFYKNKVNGIIMKLCNDKDGYKRICLTKNKKEKTIRVHRLVGIAFIPNPKNKPEINHKDNVVDNNKISNLEWNFHYENIEHKVKQGRQPKGEKHYLSKLSEIQTEEIRKSNLNQCELAEIYGISQANVSMIKNNKSRKVKIFFI